MFSGDLAFIQVRPHDTPRKTLAVALQEWMKPRARNDKTGVTRGAAESRPKRKVS
jgi:hypothetical protein